jgi:hypothetical protein
MQTLAAVTITGAASQVINLPADYQGHQLGGIRVANESSYALQVMCGALISWIDPWTVDVVKTEEVINSISISPTILLSPLPPNMPAKLLLTVADAAETIPGTYPASLPGQNAFGASPVSPLSYASADVFGANNSTNIVTGVNGQTIFIHGGYVSVIRTGGAIDGSLALLQFTSTGSVILEVPCSGVNTYPFNISGTLNSIVADAVKITTSGCTASTQVNAGIYYTQQ